jgi:hypothetical protein
MLFVRVIMVSRAVTKRNRMIPLATKNASTISPGLKNKTLADTNKPASARPETGLGAIFSAG